MNSHGGKAEYIQSISNTTFRLSFPEMIKNPNFVEECVGKISLEKTKVLYFLCRSGARSLQAASEVKNLIHHSYEKFSYITCINIRYGF